MRLGLGLSGKVRVADAAALARRAEAEGFDSVWIHETSWQRDGVVPLAAAAMATSRLRLGAGCLNPYTRHPALLAQTAAALQEASAGRLVLALGTGFPVRLVMLGIPHPSPAAAVREGIEIVRRLLAGETVTCKGTCFSIERVALDLGGSLPRPVPIYVAGWRPHMLRLAGELAQGWLARPLEPPALVRKRFDAIRRAAARVGRSLDGFEVAGYVMCAVDDDPGAAFEAVRRDPFVVYQMAVLDADVVAALGLDAEQLAAIRAAFWAGDLARASQAISREMLAHVAVFGPPGRVAEQVQAFREAGLDLPVLQPVRVDAAAMEGLWRVRRILGAGQAPGEPLAPGQPA